MNLDVCTEFLQRRVETFQVGDTAASSGSLNFDMSSDEDSLGLTSPTIVVF